MGLTYKILWVDDQIEGLIDLGLKDNLESYLADLGFIPTIACFEDTTNAKQELETTKYDLILSDFNIDDNENGDVLIEKIRDGHIFTEVLFYSAQSEFSRVAEALYQDRISFLSIAGQVSYSKLEQKVKWLIDQTIAKLQEIESIRGLVMSETSYLDNMVEGILLAYFQSNRPKTGELRRKILRKIKDSTQSNKKSAEKLGGESDFNLVKSRLFDANKKARSVTDLLTLEALDYEKQFNNFFDSYKRDVLDVRNDLAHAKAEFNDGKEYLIINRNGVEKQEVFDLPKAIQIRKNLLQYNEFLERIKAIVDTM